MTNQKGVIMVMGLCVLQIGCVSANDKANSVEPDYSAARNECRQVNSDSSGYVFSDNFEEMGSAVISGDLSRIESLTRRHAELFPRSNLPVMPVVLAAGNQSPAILKKLIQVGYPVNSDNYHQSPLEMAISSSDEVSISVLIENGANINAKGCIEGRTDFLYLIGWASFHDDYTLSPGFVRYVIASGADVSQKDWFGNNALHIALNAGNYQLLELLIDSGVSPCERNDAGESALELWARKVAEGFDKFMDEETLGLRAKLECDN